MTVREWFRVMRRDLWQRDIDLYMLVRNITDGEVVNDYHFRTGPGSGVIIRASTIIASRFKRS